MLHETIRRQYKELHTLYKVLIRYLSRQEKISNRENKVRNYR